MPTQHSNTRPSPAQPCVLLEDTGVGYIAQPGHQAFYDDGAGLLHIVEGRMVTSIVLPPPTSTLDIEDEPSPSLSLHTPRLGLITPSQSLLSTPLSTPPPSVASSVIGGMLPRHHHHRRVLSNGSDVSAGSVTARAFLVSEGPPVTAVRSSFDGALTALQRSKAQVEFIQHGTGNIFVESPQKKESELRGFFWTDTPDAEFVLVTSLGLEFFSPTPGVQGLRPTAFQRLATVQWFLWSHSTRILVCGCGSSGAKLQTFQFSRSGLIRLPLLDLTPPWGSPVKAPASHAAPWLLVTPAQVWVLLLYRRVFVAYYDQAGGTFKLYRMYRDASALFAEFEVRGRGDIEVSIVDDVIIVHHLSDGTASVLDIAGSLPGTSGGGPRILAPLCSPRRLGLVHLETLLQGIEEANTPLPTPENSEEEERQQSTTAVVQAPAMEVEVAHEIVVAELVKQIIENVLARVEEEEGNVDSIQVKVEETGARDAAAVGAKYESFKVSSSRSTDSSSANSSSSSESIKPPEVGQNPIEKEEEEAVTSSEGAITETSTKKEENLMGDKEKKASASTSSSSSSDSTSSPKVANQPPPPPLPLPFTSFPQPPTQQAPILQRMTLLHPDLALEQTSGRLFQLKLDLMAIADASPTAPRVLDFVRRRRWKPGSNPRRDPRHVMLTVLRRCVSNRVSPADLRAAFDAVLSRAKDRVHGQGPSAPAGATAAALRPGSSSSSTSPAVQVRLVTDYDVNKAIHPKEIALGILAPLLQVHDHLGGTRAGAGAGAGSSQRGTCTIDSSTSSYLQAALSELLSCCYVTGNLPIDADVAEVYVMSYCAANQEALLGPLLQSHAPLLDSPAFAERLAAGHVGPAGHAMPAEVLHALALEMYRRLGDHVAVCRLLLQQGRVVEAVRWAQRHSVTVSVGGDHNNPSTSTGTSNVVHSSGTNTSTGLAVEECIAAAEVNNKNDPVVMAAVHRLSQPVVG